MADKHDILSVLQDVQSGALTPEDALLRLKLAPFEDLGYAKVDYHRAVRQGVAEVIYGQSKTTEQILGILHSMEQRDSHNILVTRIGQDVADAIAAEFPLHYEPLARLAVVLPQEVPGGLHRGSHRRHQRHGGSGGSCYNRRGFGQQCDSALRCRCSWHSSAAG